MPRQAHRLVHGSEDVWPHELALAQDAHASTVAVEESAVLSELRELDARHVHERVHLAAAALEVLHAECVDGDVRYACAVAELEGAGESLEAERMSFHGFEAALPRETPVAVHDEGDVCGDWADAESGDEEIA